MKKRKRINKGKVLPIRVVGDKVLREKATKVEEINEELQEFIDDLIETMYVTDGVGLAAPQTGRSLRIFVCDPDWGDTKKRNPVVFINPEIVESSGQYTFEEGCLSLPGIYEEVKRPGFVRIEALDRYGEAFSMEAQDYYSTVLQHEYDHLEGILFIDRVSKLKLLPHKRKIKQLMQNTDENGVNIRCE